MRFSTHVSCAALNRFRMKLLTLLSLLQCVRTLPILVVVFNIPTFTMICKASCYLSRANHHTHMYIHSKETSGSHATQNQRSLDLSTRIALSSSLSLGKAKNRDLERVINLHGDGKIREGEFDEILGTLLAHASERSTGSWDRDGRAWQLWHGGVEVGWLVLGAQSAPGT